MDDLWDLDELSTLLALQWRIAELEAEIEERDMVIREVEWHDPEVVEEADRRVAEQTDNRGQ